MQPKKALVLISAMLIGLFLFEAVHPAGFLYPYFVQPEENTATHRKRRVPPIPAPTEELIDSYSESHYNTDNYIESNHPCGTSHRSSLGQTFTSNASYILTKAVFYLRIVGNPNGILKAALYEINASYYPIGSPLVTSDSVSLSSIGSSHSLINFSFSTQYTMSAKDYAIVVFPSGNTNFNDHLVYVDVGCETSLSDEGVYVEFIGYWNIDAVSVDTIFYVYGLHVAD